MLGYLDELDDLLGQQDLAEPVRLYIGGGAAMSTMYKQRFTNDVDVMSEGMTAEVRAAAEQVSQRHEGLGSRWLNDDAKVVRVNVTMDERLIFEGRSLSVYAAGPRYLLAAKLTAGRPSDENDCEELIRKLRIRDESELLDLIEEALPARLRTPGMEYFAMERLANARKGKWRLRFKEWRSRRASRSGSSGV